MPYTNQCFLVEVATSTSCSSSEFPYCDGNLIGTKFAHIYFNRWPLDNHDDCILVVQTYKKVAHCELWLTFDPYIHPCANMSPN